MGLLLQGSPSGRALLGRGSLATPSARCMLSHASLSIWYKNPFQCIFYDCIENTDSNLHEQIAANTLAVISVFRYVVICKPQMSYVFSRHPTYFIRTQNKFSFLFVCLPM